MLWKKAHKNLSLLCLFLLLFVLASCGGGGGSSSSGDRIDTPVVARSAGSVTTAKPALQFSEATEVTANFTNPDGSPAVGIPVNFTTSLGTLSASVAKTDANGNAKVTLTAGDTSGQGQLLASATVANRVVNLSTLFTVLLPPLTLGPVTLTGNSSGLIDYGSSQGFTVEVLDKDLKPFTAQGVEVTFSSPQVANGTATISSPVTTVNGRATATYQALTVSGTDTITAQISGSSISGATQSVTLRINPLKVGSLSFVSAQPATIGLKGMGGVGVKESSTVTFKVVDTTGQPMANQAVSFALNTTVGDLSLSATSGSTAADGTVSTIVRSGRVATPVRVTASTTVDGEDLSTQSDVLVVSTGVATQDGFSISLSNLNPESYSTDGVEVAVTARLSDHFHNPVPDGTAVYFTTSGGSISPSCVTDKGQCSVTWNSQNPRPKKANGARGDGRAVILAYAIGEESFVDLNGNGLGEINEMVKDDDEAFLDKNESGAKESESFIDFNGDGIFNDGDDKYNGVLQGADSAGAPRSKHVFSNSVLVMSTSDALISFNVGSIDRPGSYQVRVTDANGNTMPSGTTIAITAPFGTLSGATTHTVPLNTGFGVTLPFHIAGAATPKAQEGLLTVKVTSPKGLITTAYLPMAGWF